LTPSQIFDGSLLAALVPRSLGQRPAASGLHSNEEYL
jgi:hypothetical protein